MSNKSSENYILLSIILTFIDLKINITNKKQQQQLEQQSIEGETNTTSVERRRRRGNQISRETNTNTNKPSAQLNGGKENKNLNLENPRWQLAQRQRATTTHGPNRGGKQLKPTSMEIKLGNEIIRPTITATSRHTHRHRLQGHEGLVGIG